VSVWHLNQLWYAYAAYSVEGARVVLGHAKTDMTQVDAERDLFPAQRIATEVG
jgi:hypothetical protein